MRYYQLLLVTPLEYLYRHGPRSWGFWGGATNHAICTVLAPRVDGDLWQTGYADDECERMVQRDIQGWVVLVETGIYFYILYESVRWIVGGTLQSMSTCVKKAGQSVVEAWNGRRSDRDITMAGDGRCGPNAPDY